MSEIMEAGTGLGVRNPKIPESEKAKTDEHLNRIIREAGGFSEPGIIPGMSGSIGSIEWERKPIDRMSSCGKCGNILASQYGVVEHGYTEGPCYCTPECLQEAKGRGI
jgi:hypothetical protein